MKSQYIFLCALIPVLLLTNLLVASPVIAGNTSSDLSINNLEKEPPKASFKKDKIIKILDYLEVGLSFSILGKIIYDFWTIYSSSLYIP